jgi:Flp pilus assembly protein TadD
MDRACPPDLDALWREVERAVDSGRDEARMVRLLADLARRAPTTSDAWLYAVRQLAERTVGDDPWRASLIARRIVRCRPDDDSGWAILALAQSLLGHHRFAVRSYHKALALAPRNPWYAHNLGHLYDIALGQPARALPLLARALDELRSWSRHAPVDLERAIDEVRASYAHALLHADRAPEARTIMRQVIGASPKPEHHDLYAAILCAERALIAAEAPPSQRRQVRRSRGTASCPGFEAVSDAGGDEVCAV